MYDLPNPLGGRSIDRRILRQRFLDPETGEELISEHRMEMSQTFDGAYETVEHADQLVLSCGHVLERGETVARCENCSSKAGRAVYVCSQCSVQCPISGETLCVRCSALGPDGRRYSSEGLKKAKKMGLFDAPREGPVSPPCIPSRISSFFQRILEWW